jgi:hypothetical protein
VDVRRKSFVAEATSRLAFLCGEYGFAGPEVSEQQDDYPLVMRVRYHRADLDVEESLILSYGGEEYVTATVVYASAAQEPGRRTEIGADTAHTGFQMRRGLDRQAQAVRDLLAR